MFDEIPLVMVDCWWLLGQAAAEADAPSRKFMLVG
jgi:hypothetical protein